MIVSVTFLGITKAGNMAHYNPSNIRMLHQRNHLVKHMR